MWMMDKVIRELQPLPGNVHIGVFGCVDGG